MSLREKGSACFWRICTFIPVIPERQAKTAAPKLLICGQGGKESDIVGTGDFTHPAWRQELEAKLEPAEEGLYVLKDEYRIRDGSVMGEVTPRFVITGEISSIYKKNGRVRKVHSLILLPGLEDAQALSRTSWSRLGIFIRTGGRSWGWTATTCWRSCWRLCPAAVYVPAHIWTPHFSLFGAFSGFDSVEECFGDLTPYIHAMETGLSSDPPMNWRVSALDRYQLISNSDAHSSGQAGTGGEPAGHSHVLRRACGSDTVRRRVIRNNRIFP